MTNRSNHGFTLIEVAIALVLLAVGILALVGSSAMVTRMIGQGRRATFASQASTARLDWLRRLAGSTSPLCAHPQFGTGSAVTSDIGERWTVPATGNARQIVLAVESRIPGRVAHDTLRTAVLCR